MEFREAVKKVLVIQGPSTAAQIGRAIGVEAEKAARAADSLVDRGILRRDLVEEGRVCYHLYTVAQSGTQGTDDTRTRLVLSRREGEAVILQMPGGSEITLSISEIDRGRVRFSVVAPRSVRIYRDELLMGAR